MDEQAKNGEGARPGNACNASGTLELKSTVTLGRSPKKDFRVLRAFTSIDPKWPGSRKGRARKRRMRRKNSVQCEARLLVRGCRRTNQNRLYETRLKTEKKQKTLASQDG